MFKRVANLRIVSVADAGKYDRERVVLRARHACNVGRYAVIDATYAPDGVVSNINRHFFWFPDLDVDEGDYILLYTKKGQDRTFRNAEGEVIHAFYWGFDKPETVWNRDADAVTVVRVSALNAKRVAGAPTPA